MEKSQLNSPNEKLEIKQLKGTSQNIRQMQRVNGGNKVIPQLEKMVMATAMSTLKQMVFFANGFGRHGEIFMCY